MMRVYLIRHATATEGSGASDFDRQLSEVGVQEAQVAGRALRALGAKLAVILSSPLLRAAQTAQEIARAFNLGPAVELRDPLSSGADPDTYFEQLEAWEGRGEVALVGHMPDLGRTLAVLLAGRSDVSVVFKPSSVCALDVDLAARKASVVYFHGPAELKDAAEPRS
jgi:phosphohistidine phosphatase